MMRDDWSNEWCSMDIYPYKIHQLSWLFTDNGIKMGEFVGSDGKFKSNFPCPGVTRQGFKVFGACGEIFNWCPWNLFPTSLPRERWVNTTRKYYPGESMVIMSLRASLDNAAVWDYFATREPGWSAFKSIDFAWMVVNAFFDSPEVLITDRYVPSLSLDEAILIEGDYHITQNTVCKIPLAQTCVMKELSFCHKLANPKSAEIPALDFLPELLIRSVLLAFHDHQFVRNCMHTMEKNYTAASKMAGEVFVLK